MTNEHGQKEQQSEGFSRRQALGLGLVGAASVAALGTMANNTVSSDAASSHRNPSQESDDAALKEAAKPSRLPVVFLPHGGGPWPFVEVGLGSKEELAALLEYLRSVSALPATPPRALLVISAHWEEAVPTVMTAAQPPMFYDYYGFPPESYTITWPAPGHADVAARVQDLLRSNGFATGTDAQRGFDHGTFVPLKLAYPEANVPTVQLSLKRGLDPSEHLAMGRALAPLRDEGVFIIGSGMTYHNLRAFSPRAAPVAETFDRWLQHAATSPPSERAAQLTAWASAPSARQAHPREEHLLPLMVVAGAAENDLGTVAYSGSVVGLRLSAFHFG